jgi:hypothetical protein
MAGVRVVRTDMADAMKPNRRADRIAVNGG